MRETARKKAERVQEMQKAGDPNYKQLEEKGEVLRPALLGSRKCDMLFQSLCPS